MNRLERSKCARPKPRSGRMVESLESRQLCSVTVSQGYPGYYTISGDSGDNTNNLINASGNNYGVSIAAGNGNNTIYGSNYDDYISVGTGSNVICCLNGNDTVYCRNGSADTVIGGSGNDTVFGDTRDSVY